ncbi:unnamed protein product [Tilletia caries]|uniref:RlpA-like protein double-psi beta-barrel domain-containing protein n=1 Tax=Tilletia caries TaxID=13290 RepID=A0ABN7IHV4_9BASI|nr:unnamed protein product [Tilletia caries]CAD6955823.1 unnamed protein product [Tilletia caries]CAD7067946.1 unnamed protein product [Tilletia caries]
MHLGTQHVSILLVVLMSTTPKIILARGRDVSYPPCDHLNGTQSIQFRQTVRPITWVTTGIGACGIAYDDWDYGVCVKPGYVHSAHRSHCGAKVQLSLRGRNVYANVVDVCGAAHDSPMGCDDLVLTKAPFVALGGDVAGDGYLRGNVSWRFV